MLQKICVAVNDGRSQSLESKFMSHKQHGQLTTSNQWARHLRPFWRKLFWKAERRAVRDLLRTENNKPEKPAST